MGKFLKNKKMDKIKYTVMFGGKYGTNIYDNDSQKLLTMQEVADELNAFENFINDFKEGDEWIKFVEESRKKKKEVIQKI